MSSSTASTSSSPGSSAAASTSTSTANPKIQSFVSTNRSRIRDEHDAAILTLHALLQDAGFQLIAVSDKPSTTAAAADANAANANTRNSQHHSAAALSALPDDWNSTGDSYTFVYTHPSVPDTTLLVKGVKMDRLLIIHAMRKTLTSAASTSAPSSCDVNVDDYITNDGAQMFRDLDGLVTLYRTRILAHVVPPPPSTATDSAAARNPPITDPYTAGPRPSPFTPPSSNPRGDDDEDHRNDPDYDPLRVYPRRQRIPGMGGDFGGDLNPIGGVGGNLMGPNNFPFPSSGRPLGGPSHPGMGPRFDPYGPVPGLGEPDNDAMLPPGMQPPIRNPRGPPFGGGFGGGGGFPPPRGFGGGGGGFGF